MISSNRAKFERIVSRKFYISFLNASRTPWAHGIVIVHLQLTDLDEMLVRVHRMANVLHAMHASQRIGARYSYGVTCDVAPEELNRWMRSTRCGRRFSYSELWSRSIVMCCDCGFRHGIEGSRAIVESAVMRIWPGDNQVTIIRLLAMLWPKLHFRLLTDWLHAPSVAPHICSTS